MRGVQIHTVGGEPVFAENIENPKPRKGNVLVQTEMAGVNAIDLAIAAGQLPLPPAPLPYVPGREGIGIVMSRGPFRGKRVWFEAPGGLGGNGSMAEETHTNEDILVEIPHGLTSSDAARYGISGTAAWLALQWRGGIRRGETVLVLGASGVVGQIAVQAARSLGAYRVVAAARSVDDRSLFRGADAVVQLDGGDDLAERFIDAAGGPIDLTIDPIWGDAAVAAIDATADGGRLVQMGSSASPKADVPGFLLRPQTHNGTLISGKNVSILGHTNMATPVHARADAYRELISAVAYGDIEIPGRVYALEDADEAFRAQRASAHQKIVVNVSGT